jgi:hypothetical protein
MFEPDPFVAKFLVYSTLLGVLLIINGIILAAWAQSARDRDRKDKPPEATHK